MFEDVKKRQGKQRLWNIIRLVKNDGRSIPPRRNNQQKMRDKHIYKPTAYFFLYKKKKKKKKAAYSCWRAEDPS